MHHAGVAASAPPGAHSEHAHDYLSWILSMHFYWLSLGSTGFLPGRNCAAPALLSGRGTWFLFTHSLSLVLSSEGVRLTRPFSNRWCLLTISRRVEILTLTQHSGPVATAGPSKASAGWLTKCVSTQQLIPSWPETERAAAAPAQRTQRSVFQLGQFVMFTWIWGNVCWAAKLQNRMFYTSSIMV